MGNSESILSEIKAISDRLDASLCREKKELARCLGAPESAIDSVTKDTVFIIPDIGVQDLPSYVKISNLLAKDQFLVSGPNWKYGEVGVFGGGYD